MDEQDDKRNVRMVLLTPAQFREEVLDCEKLLTQAALNYLDQARDKGLEPGVAAYIVAFVATEFADHARAYPDLPVSVTPLNPN